MTLTRQFQIEHDPYVRSQFAFGDWDLVLPHLETMTVPRRVCFLFGQEGPGLSEVAREVCDGTFSIAQFGSTRSINASAAAAIAMHSWVRTYADLSGDTAWRG